MDALEERERIKQSYDNLMTVFTEASRPRAQTASEAEKREERLREFRDGIVRNPTLMGLIQANSDIGFSLLGLNVDFALLSRMLYLFLMGLMALLRFKSSNSYV